MTLSILRHAPSAVGFNRVRGSECKFSLKLISPETSSAFLGAFLEALHVEITGHVPAAGCRTCTFIFSAEAVSQKRMQAIGWHFNFLFWTVTCRAHLSYFRFVPRIPTQKSQGQAGCKQPATCTVKSGYKMLTQSMLTRYMKGMPAADTCHFLPWRLLSRALSSLGGKGGGGGGAAAPRGWAHTVQQMLQHVFGSAKVPGQAGTC